MVNLSEMSRLIVSTVFGSLKAEYLYITVSRNIIKFVHKTLCNYHMLTSW